jgi:DNA repair and recombination protein RAD54B
MPASLPPPVVKKPPKAEAETGYPLSPGCYLDGWMAKQMREHQLVGVRFLFECVGGLKGSEINGAILADTMGMGKTLQAIGLVWACLRTSPQRPDKPMIAKAAVVCPLTLVQNWQN